MKTQDIKTALRRFHQEEDGLEATQVVMILAIAAVALLLVKSAWPAVSSWFTRGVDELLR